MPQPAGKQHRYTYTATAALCTRTQRHLPQMQWAFCRPEGAHTVNATHTWHSSDFTTCSREQRWNEHFEFLYLKQVNVHCTQREKDNFHAKRQHLLRFGEGLFTFFINEQITHREKCKLWNHCACWASQSAQFSRVWAWLSIWYLTYKWLCFNIHVNTVEMPSLQCCADIISGIYSYLRRPALLFICCCMLQVTCFY